MVMWTSRHAFLVLAMAGLLGGCATGGGDAKFKLSDGVVRIIEQEGRIDLAEDPRVACIEDQVTGSRRVLRLCATREEFRTGAWRDQFSNLSSIDNLHDLQHEPSAVIQ
jgi:hypothetical protein